MHAGKGQCGRGPELCQVQLHSHAAAAPGMALALLVPPRARNHNRNFHDRNHHHTPDFGVNPAILPPAGWNSDQSEGKGTWAKALSFVPPALASNCFFQGSC